MRNAGKPTPIATTAQMIAPTGSATQNGTLAFDVSAAPDQRSDRNERELAEADLAGPSRQHDQRQQRDREDRGQRRAVRETGLDGPWEDEHEDPEPDRSARTASS